MKVVAEICSWIVAAGVWFTEFERGTVAEWFSGVASAAAVIVALWLAYKAHKIKLVGQFDFMAAYPHGTKLVAISATNVGQRNATVNNVAFCIQKNKFGRPPKDPVWMIIPNQLRGSTLLPATLADGKSGQWLYPAEPTVKELADFVKTEKDARLLRCVLSTAHGKNIMLNPSEHLLDIIIKKIKHE